MARERDYSVDRLRVLLCLMVITMHVVADRIYAAQPGSLEYHVLLGYTCLCRAAVPCFFMISGAFSRYDLKKAVKNALVFTAVLVAAAELYRVSDILLASGSMADFHPVEAFFQYKYHLWYLFHFVTVSLVGPILVAAVEARAGLEKYVIGLLLLFTVLPNTVSLFVGNVLPLRFLEMFDPHLPGYLLYYLLGRVLYARREALCRLRWLPVAGYLLSSGLIFTLERWKTVSQGYQGDVFFFNFNALILCQAVAVFCMGLRLPGTERKGLSALSGAGLAVYIVHVFFIDWLTKFGFRADFIHPALGVPLKVLCVYLLSVGVALLFRWAARLLRVRKKDRVDYSLSR